MAGNLLYEKRFVNSMHKEFQVILSRVRGTLTGGVKYEFLPRPSDMYTIYALDGCPHSEAAVGKVTRWGLQHRAFYIARDLGMTKAELRDILLHHTDMDKHHKTWPVIFKESRFIGGNDSL